MVSIVESQGQFQQKGGEIPLSSSDEGLKDHVWGDITLVVDPETQTKINCEFYNY